MVKKLFNFIFILLPFFLISQPVYADTSPWGDCVVDGVPTLKCLEIVFGNIIFMSTGLIILALFVMFVVGSFLYLTSLGNPEKVKKAQGTLKFALLGFILFIGSFLILNIIQILFLGGGSGKVNLFKFEIPGP